MHNIIKKTLSAILVLSIVMTCGSFPYSAAASRPTKLIMNKKCVLVKVGGKTKLSVKEVRPKGASKSVKYEIANRKIARVSKGGMVRGKSVGITTVRATSKKNKHLHVLIKIMVAKTVPKKVKVTPSSVIMTVGDSAKLTSKVTPSKVAAKYRKGTWISNNIAVASVTEKGVVTAVGSGTTKISFTTFNGKKAVCTVTVNPLPETESSPEVTSAPEQTAEATGPAVTAEASTNAAIATGVPSGSAVAANLSSGAAASTEVGSGSAVTTGFVGTLKKLLALIGKEC
jgi:hypothetical protein